MKQAKTKYILIADAINEDIKNDKVKPGERLATEHELQHRFNVSRMTIRHALSELEKRKIVRIDYGRGASVTEMEDDRSMKDPDLWDDMCYVSFSRAKNHLVILPPDNIQIK